MKTKLLACVVLVAFAAGCSQAPRPARSPLDLPYPEPLRMRPVQWHIIPQGLDGSERDKHTPFIALTEDGYKNLAQNVRDAASHIGLQRKIIQKYKHYYESGE